MTAQQFPVILSAGGAAADNEDVVADNVAVVNEMYLACLHDDEIAPNALRSYYVDFYLTQALDGGFAQYVSMTEERDELDVLIREGLAAMGACKHLSLFDRTAARYGLLSEMERESYLDDGTGATSGRSKHVAAMEALDNEFEELFEAEDVTGLNAAWLCGQEGLLILDAEGMVAHIAARVALVPDLQERRDEAELGNAPEFELIIRELCSVSGHQLERILMGDPNHEHNKESVLAWHFRTNKGEFIMIDDAARAFMLDPRTQEIVAAVEFELENDFAGA